MRRECNLCNDIHRHAFGRVRSLVRPPGRIEFRLLFFFFLLRSFLLPPTAPTLVKLGQLLLRYTVGSFRRLPLTFSWTPAKAPYFWTTGSAVDSYLFRSPPNVQRYVGIPFTWEFTADDRFRVEKDTHACISLRGGINLYPRFKDWKPSNVAAIKKSTKEKEENCETETLTK